jgi:hypothetical protein
VVKSINLVNLVRVIVANNVICLCTNPTDVIISPWKQRTQKADYRISDCRGIAARAGKLAGLS